jgi:CRP-like cAMP-binding protein
MMKVGQEIIFSHEGKEEITLDGSLLKNIIINLVSNAIKFSAENTPIHISSSCVEDEFVIKVKDKGIGISKEDQEHLMDRFFRGANAGDFLGHIALLQGSVYRETAEAIDDCEIAIIPKKEFEELLGNSKEVAQKFIDLLAKNIADKEHHLLNLAYNSLRKKVADALMALKNKYHVNGNAENFRIDISRENLANIAGTATESLIRTLCDFKNEKLIDIKDGHITIMNEKKLDGMIN